MGAHIVPPYMPVLFSWRYPHHMAVEYWGVKPQNHRSREFSEVPVLPAASCPFDSWAPVPVPLVTTFSSIFVAS